MKIKDLISPDERTTDQLPVLARAAPLPAVSVNKAEELENFRQAAREGLSIHVGDLRAFDISAVNHEVERQPHREDERERIARAVLIWEEAGDPRRTLAEKYLNETRALDMPENLCGEVLRFHPHCPWRDENTGNTILISALIAAFTSIDDDQFTGIHRVALNPDGTKRALADHQGISGRANSGSRRSGRWAASVRSQPSR